MGRPKALLDAGGRTTLEEVLARARLAGAGRLRVVLGNDSEEIVRNADLAGVGVAINPAPARGRTSSIQEGLRALGACEGILLWPVDLPWVAPGTAAKVMEVGRLGRVAVPEHGAKRGHPILIAADLLPGVLALGPDDPLNKWVRRQTVDLVPVDDPATTVRMNTAEEYEAAFARFASGGRDSPGV